MSEALGYRITQSQLSTKHFGTLQITVVRNEPTVIPEGTILIYFFEIEGRPIKGSLIYRGRNQLPDPTALTTAPISSPTYNWYATGSRSSAASSGAARIWRAPPTPRTARCRIPNDGAHHVLSRTDAKGQVTGYSYDAYGRLTALERTIPRESPTSDMPGGPFR